MIFVSNSQGGRILNGWRRFAVGYSLLNLMALALNTLYYGDCLDWMESLIRRIGGRKLRYKDLVG